MAVLKYGRSQMGRLVVHRVLRLYVPFLLWSGIYLAARGVNFVLFGKETMLRFTPGLFYWGTTYHLWFLPYLLIATLLSLPVLVYAVSTVERRVQFAIVFAGMAIMLLFMPTPDWVVPNGEPIAVVSQLYVRGPGFLIGLALGLWVAAGVKPRVSLPIALVAMVITAVAIVLVMTTEVNDRIFIRIAATAAFVVAMGPWRGPIAERLGKLGQLGFGVYLSHVLFTEAAYSALNFTHVPLSLLTDLGVWVFTAVASFTFVWWSRKSKYFQWLFP